jgi:hypothetical protein
VRETIEAGRTEASGVWALELLAALSEREENGRKLNPVGAVVKTVYMGPDSTLIQKY